MLNAIDVEDTISFVAQHDSPMHYAAALSVLPKELLKEIWHSWGQSLYTLSNRFHASTDAVSVRFVQKTIEWYREAAFANRQTCWASLDTAQNHLMSHKDVFGAINNLLYDPHTVQDDMGFRYRDLPPGKLRADFPMCFDSVNNQTRWLERHMKRWTTTNSLGKSVYIELTEIRRLINAWGGPLARLLLDSFCISLGTVELSLPSKKYYWFVAGESQPKDSQRWTFDSLDEFDDGLSIPTGHQDTGYEDTGYEDMVDEDMNGSPEDFVGPFQESNDYSHRKWDLLETGTSTGNSIPRKLNWIPVHGSSRGGSKVAAEAQELARAGYEVEV
ncbi:hypothetical protein CP532_1460 [Ophiocordyceps camponoti-leonardi (nom. inval.)]|nr:hypothetical protein CP532_1460 [Ophiocordyceps camponoti-leonardi (nom. inval.)]